MTEPQPAPNLCIYHANCADGFGAAWAVRQYFNAGGRDAIDFHPGVHQDPPPDVTGRIVYLVDFSYKRPVLLNMARQARRIVILDHHKTAAADLVDLPANVSTVFDLDRSGARIAWDFFFPRTTPPPLIDYIQDRDLWRFDLPRSREVAAGLFSYPYDFAIWSELMKPHRIDDLADAGAAIERKHFKDIHEFIAAAGYRATIAGHSVPVLNAPYFWTSDAGHIMAKGEPFAACYWDTPNGRVFSLRSTDDGLDVSEIAARFGGGGHRNAAGFRVPLSAGMPQPLED